MAASKLKKVNQSSATVTTAGSAIGIISVFILQQFGVQIDPVQAASLSGAVALLANLLIPAKE